jgi:hypothetical protein
MVYEWLTTRPASDVCWWKEISDLFHLAGQQRKVETPIDEWLLP